jgi:hypothetical protein
MYDHWEDHGLRKLFTFVDVVSLPERALMRDISQDSAGYAIPFRSHSAQKRQHIHHAIRTIWGDFDSIDDLGAVEVKEIDSRMSSYLAEHRHELWRVFRWRQAHENRPKPVLNRLLNEMGLKLEKVRSGGDKGKYLIQRAAIQEMRGYARVHIANDPTK